MEDRRDFSDREREGVYRAIRERRDIRRFRPGHVADDVLRRLLTAASQAPSVGYMQPWNFLVLRDRAIRARIHEAFLEANAAAARLFVGARGERYRSLKLEGILDADLNVCFTCDRTRFGPVVLGRSCQPEMDLYSTVCAVQNFWLAARAEGIGVGWVSIVEKDDIARILALPPGVVPVAYLCVGYPEAFPAEPELKTVGWAPALPLGDLIFHDRWGTVAG